MQLPEDREFRLAFCKLHVLHHAAKRPIYGLWMLQELGEHGHVLSPGTLYPLLARMEKNGWLRCRSQGGAKERKDYRITRAGRKLLEQLRREVEELYRELVLDEEPEHRPGESP
jgi:PadR family transcriptional regulator, regulatory protein PadR